MTDTLLLTMDEAARELRISRREAYRMAARGELPSVKLGYRRRVPRALLEQYVRDLPDTT